ncbi:MAG TPA: hypothetical protein VGN16_22560 [Acidobacteriaceae bacterium]|jgi:hypothetical protein
MIPTRDHTQIRAWAAKRNAVPAQVKPLHHDGESTILHFLFGREVPGTSELQPISWEEFFARFDLLNLSMAWDERSNLFDIVRVGKASLPVTDHH